jgi:hypothetical protein
MKTNPTSETALRTRMQRIEDNVHRGLTQGCKHHRYEATTYGARSSPPRVLDPILIEWLIVPTGDALKGKEQIAKLAPNHWAASPDRLKTLVNVFASEEFACLEYRTAGTLSNQADFPSISFQPTGKHYEFLCCFVFHIANGKIDRVHEYFDLETVKRQLETVESSNTLSA